MDQDQIRAEVERIVRGCGRSRALPDRLPDEGSLRSDWNVNSPDLVEIVLDLEQRFDIHITDDEVDNLRTFADVLSLTSAKTARATVPAS